MNKVIWCIIFTLVVILLSAFSTEEKRLRVIEMNGTTITLVDNKGYQWVWKVEQSQTTYISIGSEFIVKKAK